MDLTEIECEYQEQKVYSFLSLAWAVIAECDINSEFMRCIGKPRFTLYGIYRVCCKKLHRASLNFYGCQVKHKNEVESLNNKEFTHELPEFNETPNNDGLGHKQFTDTQF